MTSAGTGEAPGPLLSRARAAFLNGRYGEADGLFADLLRRQESAGVTGAALGRSLYEWGAVRKMEGRCQAASALALRGIRILEADPQARAPEKSEAWRVLGSSYYCGHLYYKAEDAYRHALDVENGDAAPDQAAIFESQSGLGAAYHGEGKYTRAEAAYGAARATLEANRGIDARLQAFLFVNLGALLRTEGRYAECESALREGLAALDRDGGRDDDAEAYLLNNLAMDRMERKAYADAAGLLARAAGLIEHGAAVPTVDKLSLLRNYALCLRKTGEKAKARETESEIARLAAGIPADRQSGMVADVSQIARGK